MRHVAHVGQWDSLCGMPILPSIMKAIVSMGEKLVEAEQAGENVLARMDSGGILNVDAAFAYLEERHADLFTVELSSEEIRELLILAMAASMGGAVAIGPTSPGANN